MTKILNYLNDFEFFTTNLRRDQQFYELKRTDYLLFRLNSKSKSII